MKKSNVVGAFMIAPAMPGLVLMIMAIVITGSFDGVWVLFGVFSLTYLITFLFGLPIYLTLKKYNYHGIVAYILSGFVISLILTVWIYSWDEPGSRLISLYSVIACLTTVLVFWFIARPDRLFDKESAVDITDSFE